MDRYRPKLPIIKVIITNPLSENSRLLINKFLNGSIFGKGLLVNLTLLTNSQQDLNGADVLKNRVEKCAFCCMGTFEVGAIQEIQSSLETADFIIFLSNLPNPNHLHVNHPKDGLKEDNLVYESLSLLIMIARYLDESFTDASFLQEKLKVVADGLIGLHILNKFCRNIPSNLLFCPTPLETIAKLVLCKHLKVPAHEINDLMIWAADDEVFHIEVDRPILLHDMIYDHDSKCDHSLLDKEFMESSRLDYITFSDAWLKKELKQWMRRLSLANGEALSNSRRTANALKTVWSSRNASKKAEIYCSLGLVRAGMVLVLPVVLHDGKWTMNKKYAKTTQVKNEIIKITKAVHSLAQSIDAAVSQYAHNYLKNYKDFHCRRLQRQVDGAHPDLQQLENRSKYDMNKWGF